MGMLGHCRRAIDAAKSSKLINIPSDLRVEDVACRDPCCSAFWYSWTSPVVFMHERSTYSILIILSSEGGRPDLKGDALVTLVC